MAESFGRGSAPNTSEKSLWTISYPDGLNITDEFDSSIIRRIQTGDVSVLDQIRKNSLSKSVVVSSGVCKTSQSSNTEVCVDDDSKSDVDEGSRSSWCREATECLISLYEELEEELEDPRRKKKDVWKKISLRMKEMGFSFSLTQIENKWRSLLQSHKDLADSKKKTGEKRKNFQYFERINAILSKRHDISPPFVSGSLEKKKDGTIENCQDEENERISYSKSAKRRREKRQSNADDEEPVLKFLKEIELQRKKETAEREERKEKREAEKNALLREMIQLLKN